MRNYLYITACCLIITGCMPCRNDSAKIADSTNITSTGKSVLIIDVRSAEEYSAGHIKGAVNIPDTEIAKEIENYTKDKSRKILLYCRTGRRAGIALETLTNLGYTNVENIGGYEDAKVRLK